MTKKILTAKNNYKYLKVTKIGYRTIVIFENQLYLIHWILSEILKDDYSFSEEYSINNLYDLLNDDTYYLYQKALTDKESIIQNWEWDNSTGNEIEIRWDRDY